VADARSDGCDEKETDREVSRRGKPVGEGRAPGFRQWPGEFVGSEAGPGGEVEELGGERGGGSVGGGVCEPLETEEEGECEEPHEGPGRDLVEEGEWEKRKEDEGSESESPEWDGCVSSLRFGRVTHFTKDRNKGIKAGRQGGFLFGWPRLVTYDLGP
jgi:hypothetical protein